MLQIGNQTLLGDVVEKSVDQVRQSCQDQNIRDRWVAAIVKAANFLRSNDLTFLQYDREKGELLMLADSNNIYATNTGCQCTAYTQFNQPCYHRAMARIIRRYFERENEVPVVVYRESTAMHTCSDPECGWGGTRQQLVLTSAGAVCPKCESTVEAVPGRMAPASLNNTITRARAFQGAI